MLAHGRAAILAGESELNEPLAWPDQLPISRRPPTIAFSATNWGAGLFTIGSISFGCDLVAGRKWVLEPTAGMASFLAEHINKF